MQNGLTERCGASVHDRRPRYSPRPESARAGMTGGVPMLRRRAHAEIEPHHLWVLQKRLRRPFEPVMPLLQYVAVICDCETLAGALLYHQHGNAKAVDGVHHREHLVLNP